jgi:hypothetical protein
MLADFFMPIFLGHRLVLVELMRFVQGSQPIGAGSGGGEPTPQVLFSMSPMHATGQGRKSDGECASLATARTEDLAAKQGLSLRLLRIYLMFDLSLPGGYALQTFAGFTRAYASRTL